MYAFTLLLLCLSIAEDSIFEMLELFQSIEFVFVDITEFSLVAYKSFCSDYYDCFLLCTWAATSQFIDILMLKLDSRLELVDLIGSLTFIWDVRLT